MLAPHVATVLLVTLAVGLLMAIAGLQKNALELRKRRRTAPARIRASALRLLRRPALQLLRDARRGPP